MNYAKCVTSLNLGDKIPARELKDTAAAYQKQGMPAADAMIRAVEDKLELMQMEERKIVKAVRAAYEEQGGKKRAPKPKKPSKPVLTVVPKAEPAVEEAAVSLETVKVKDKYGRTHTIRKVDLDGEANRIPTVRKDGTVVSGEEIPRSIIKQDAAVKYSVAEDPKQPTAKEFREEMLEKYPGVRLDLFDRGNGDLNLSLVIVPKDERNTGTGTALMKDMTAFADATGKRIVLTPSDDFGGNKARLRTFYKRFGFVENKGRSKDFAIMDAMYREPQGDAKYSVIQEQAAAINRLMAEKAGEATVNVPGLGEVTIQYGDDKARLAHIEKRRGADFIKRLPELLASGRVYEKGNQKGRVFIGNDRDEAVISLDRDGEADTWLLSAYEKYPDLKESRRSEVVDDRMPDGKFFTKEDLRKSLTSQGVLGQVIASMVDKGIIVLHGGPNKLPGAARRTKGVQAVTMPDGTIHMVASNLTPRTAMPVLLHEMLHQGGEKLIGSKEWGNLMGRLGSLYRQSEQSSGKARVFYDRARARVDAARRKGAVGRAMEVEEFAAYAIEEYEKDPRSLPAAIRKWVEDMLGLIKTWMVKNYGRQLGAVTPAQLSAMARWALMDVAVDRRVEIFGPIAEVFSTGEEKTIEINGERKPITNSDGNLIAEDMNKQVKFYRWFGDSKVADRSGAPLVVYHGTRADIAEFKKGESPWDDGIFFTSDKGVASSVYAGGQEQFNEKALLDKLNKMSGEEIDAKLEEARKAYPRLDFYDDFIEPFGNPRADLAAYLADKADIAEGLDFWPNRVTEMFGVTPRTAAEGSNVIPAYLSIQNPLEINAKGLSFDKEQQAGWLAQARSEGRDGVILRNYDDGGFGAPGTYQSAGRHDVYVAFDPKQVKSAIGNNGDFNATNPDIRYSVDDDTDTTTTSSASPEREGFTPPEQGRLRRLQATVQDNMNRVKQVQDRIMKLTGRTTLGKADYYGAETNRPGRIAARREDFRDQMLAPLVQKLAKAGYKPEQLEGLLHAMHAAERNEAVAKINPKHDPASGQYEGTQGSGMNDEVAEEILRQYAGDTKLHALAKEARDIARATLDLKLAYGLMRPEDHKLLTKQYKYYIPLKGDAEYGPKVKRATGHDTREEHILENIARDYEQATVVGEKNLARQALLQMVLKFVDPELWSVGLPPKGKYVAGKSFSVERNGKSEAVFTSMPQVNAFLEAKGAEAANYTVLDSAGERVVEFNRPLQDNEVMVYVNGDPVRIQIQDEALARQLRPLDNAQMHPILEGMRTVNRHLSRVYTGYNPAFIFKNAVRDAITGTINMTGNQGAGVAAKAWLKYPNALKTMGQWAAAKKTPDSKMGRYLNEYRMHGGKTGASYMSDLEEQGKTIQQTFDDARGLAATAMDAGSLRAAGVAWRKSVGKLAHVIEVGNQATENALRLSLYAALRDEGMSPGKAAQAAKTVTVDFDRKGKQTAALGAIYLFLNPAIQGTANAMKTLTKGDHKAQAWTALGGLAMLGAYAASQGMDEDKDRWLGRSWDERTKSLVMNVGGNQFKLPLSQEFAPAYALGVAIQEALRGEKPMRSAVRVASSFFDAYFPLKGAFKDTSDNRLADVAQAVTPTVLKPLVESGFNRSSFGSQVVPENEQTKNRPDNLKMNRGTKGTVYDATAQGIAAAGELLGAGKYENDITKVSPETLKSLWRTYTGGLGAFVTDSIGAGRIGLDSPGELELADVPVVKDFVREKDVKPVRGRYYDLAKEAQEAITEFKEAKKAGDGVEMEKIIADQDKARMIGMGKMVQSTNKALAALADAKVDVNQSKEMSIGEKRLALKKIEQQEEEMYRAAIGAFTQ